MSRYIFLDNWVLSDYTKPDKLPYLSSYIRNRELTIAIDSLSFTELYNPGWASAQGQDRMARAISFISTHATIIVDPVKLIRAEIENYPEPVQSLPIELDLDVMSEEDREESLTQFLHHDEVFLKQGKDIRVWVENYEKEKSKWLGNIDKIIDNAVQSGLLTRDQTGQFTQWQKENFLITLDRRHFIHFSKEEWEQLGAKIVQLFMDGTSKLPAVRSTSLYFWYAYIETDKNHPISKSPSDLGDFYQMSMIPYCETFTTDNKMQWLTKRIAEEIAPNSCRVLNRGDLDKEIGFIS
jgi:hypothetical protein